MILRRVQEEAVNQEYHCSWKKQSQKNKTQEL